MINAFNAPTFDFEDSENDALLTIRELRRAGYEVSSERVETAEAMAAARHASRGIW